MTQISFLPEEKPRDFILLMGRDEPNILVCFQNILLKIIWYNGHVISHLYTHIDTHTLRNGNYSIVVKEVQRKCVGIL